MRPQMVLLGLLCGLSTAAYGDATVRIRNLKVLAVIYRGGPGDGAHLDAAAVRRAQAGFELARGFYFRNSRARLNLEFDWRIIDATAPDNDGPTIEHIEADLRERGVASGQYDGLIVTGLGLTGNFGGFTVLGGAGGCFGIGGFGGVGYPAFDAGTGYGWAWIVAHEFQHALDLVIVEASDLHMLHAHPYVDRHEPFFKENYLGGEHWDWIALTLREFDDYLAIRGLTNSSFECADADADGLADDDPRLPMDERRFGSDPTKRDTDGDGLDDLAEFIADRFAGSDPRAADTDGDGLADAADPYPVVSIRPEIPYTVVERPDADALGLLLDRAFVRNDAGGDVRVRAAWSTRGLHFQFVGPRPLTVRLKLDGSADNGFWQGGDSYLLKISEGLVEFAGLGLSGAVPRAYAERRLPGPGAYVLDVFIPARLGQGVSHEINHGGSRDPEDVVDGLTLVRNRSIGVNVIYEFAGGTQAVMTPHHTMYATRLHASAGTVVSPLLRGPRRTNALVPAVAVLGVADDADVAVRTGRLVVGRRIGPGAVHLAGLTSAGAVELVAEARGATSAPWRLVVDRGADPPRLTLQMPAAGRGRAWRVAGNVRAPRGF